MKKKFLLPLLLWSITLVTACRAPETTKELVERPVLVPTVIAPLYDAEWDQGVTLTETKIVWHTYDYELDEDHSVIPSSFDEWAIVSREYKAYMIENEYLKITLVPEFGGRILSMIYKPTGHEELWQNPVGAPYLIGDQIFYHDWLMIWGGIFPTYPEPEHGKTWLLPWDFEVITDNGDVVEIEMSFTDNIDNPNAPSNYPTNETGIICRYRVRLEDGRAAIDTHVELENPNESPRQYEYWTNTGLAPGSEPGNSFADENAEMIIPIEEVRLPPWYYELAKEEEPTGEERVVRLDKLRWFRNWQQEGILYAYPDMGGMNYWGVINHGNEEGIFRIADNDKTPGLKFWTFGYDSINVDPFAGARSSRAFIELWAGVTNEFFQKTMLMAGEVYEFDETYSPSVGMTNVNGASENILVNGYWNDEGQFILQWHAINPETKITIIFKQDETILLDRIYIPDTAKGNLIQLEQVSHHPITVLFIDTSGEEIYTTEFYP